MARRFLFAAPYCFVGYFYKNYLLIPFVLSYPYQMDSREYKVAFFKKAYPTLFFLSVHVRRER